MSKYIDGAPKKRGRPKSNTVDHFNSATVGSPEVIFALRDSVAQTFPKMSPTEQNRLAEMVFKAYGYFIALSGVRLSRGFKGRPFQIHTTVLIRDCAVALAKVTGKPIRVWVDDIGQNSPAVKLAQVCIELATGKPYPFSLKRQANRAREILRQLRSMSSRTQ